VLGYTSLRVVTVIDMEAAMLMWRRRIALVIALTFINTAGLTGATYAQDRWLFGPGYPPWPTPSNASSWCQQRWYCGQHGCKWQRICLPQSFATSYIWQVQDNWPPQALARYDDAWCRIYGPPGSAVYRQCRENNYYTRLSVPIRATK
jgi:hypothetical protein